ncbi:MAG TPA: LLM class flavin-dependent oxidoreductase [Solirubrobacteraceae bacterium]|nr:LLM class flavin-dependent oxidoreductase [Solirubrobacteraceae bacterium]
MPELEFYAMHHDAYRWMPHKSVVGEHSRSNFISLPSEFYDKALGQRSMDDFVDVAINAERLGFDGILHSEHHNTPIGISAQAMVTSAYLAARTERILIAAVGPVLNAYLSPVRLAEEVALVDMLSNGRLILGLPMGIGAQYHSYGVTNPSLARARYREAHELLIRAMTEPGPFEFEGEFFHVPYVNLWPRPVQEPHPPIWIPAAGSRETLELCARHRYTYQVVGGSREVNLRNITLFRELCEQQGYTAGPNQVAAVALIHTAETDRQARLEAEAHLGWQMQNFLRSTFQDSFAPGHVSETSLRATALATGGYRSRDFSDVTWDDMIKGNLIAGSPETVAERVEELTSEMHAGRIILMFDHGSTPRWMIDKSMGLFAEQVMPRFRPPGGRPIWARGEDRRKYTTASECAALAGAPRAIPAARLADGTIVDVRTAHVPELREPAEL